MIPKLLLIRATHKLGATLGTLEIGGPAYKHFATLERTSKLFPAGEYRMVYEHSNKFKRQLWELKGIPGRAEIKIHNANTADQLDGCIAIGMRHGILKLMPAVLSSRLALEQFNDALIPYQHLTLYLEVIDTEE